MNILTPKDNYNIDTRPDEIKGLNKIADYVRDQESKEKSISNVVTQTIQTGTFVSQNYLYTASNFVEKEKYHYLLTKDAQGIPTYSAGIDENFPKLLFSPTTYKLNSVKEIALSCNLGIIPNSSIDFFAPHGTPVATSDYSIDYYVVINKFANNLLLPIANFISETLLYFKYTFSYTKTSDSWSITDNQTLFLSDTIVRDTYLTLPDFRDTTPTNANDKITQAQYDSLATQNQDLYIVSGFDATQETALSGVSYLTWLTTPSDSNKAHCQAFLTSRGAYTGATYKALPSYYLVNAFLTFTYFGLLSPYTPNS